MSVRFRTLLFAAPLPFLVACGPLQQPYDDMQADIGKSMARENAKMVRPGLEGLSANPYRGSDDMDQPMAPVLPPPESLPFPDGRLGLAQAEILLAGDPMALRFLTLKWLTAQGLLPVEEAVQRRDANLGALLPLTTPQPPAKGLEKPIPAASRIIAEINGLATGKGRGTRQSREAERSFLVDKLLPAAPTERQSWSPHDIASARKLQERLGRLEDSGLITPQQRAQETDALNQLIASGTLPEVVPQPLIAAAPKAPEPPKKPAAKGGDAKSGAPGAGARVSRMPGGVSGQLVVIPSPPEVTPPKLTATTTQAGAFLLAVGTAAHGDKAWEGMKPQYPELANLGHTVARVDLGELGVTYRLIAGPMSPADSETLCTALKARGQDCSPTPFPAQ